jgi:hypothetical protein
MRLTKNIAYTHKSCKNRFLPVLTIVFQFFKVELSKFLTAVTKSVNIV